MKPMRPRSGFRVVNNVPIIGQPDPRKPPAGKYFFFIQVGVTPPGGSQRLEGFECWFPEPLVSGMQLYRLGHGYAALLKELADEQKHKAALELDPNASKPDTPLCDVAPLAFQFLRFEAEGAAAEPTPQETLQ